jgi:hypothetical protein
VTCEPRTNAGARSNTDASRKNIGGGTIGGETFYPGVYTFSQASPSPQTLPLRAAPTTSSSYRSRPRFTKPRTHVLWCAQAKTSSGQNYYLHWRRCVNAGHHLARKLYDHWLLQASLPDTDTRRPWEATVIATGHLYCGLRPDLLPFSYRCATSSSATPRRIWSADRGVAPSVRDPEPTRQPNADPYPTSRPT